MQDKEAHEKSRPENVIKAYRERLTLLKKAQEYSKRNDIPKAVEKYAHYLNVLASYFDLPEEKLSPSLFDREREITELLLISHAYWDLAKAYDRSPKLVGESVRCLEQFVKFSEGNKFQYVNAQMLKKFIKKKHAYHPKHFQTTYKKMYVKGKSCYIATYCYGVDHPTTSYFRSVRTKMSSSPLGLELISQYYRLSPKVLSSCHNHPLIGVALKYFFFFPLLEGIKVILTIIDRLHVYFKKTHH